MYKEIKNKSFVKEVIDAYNNLYEMVKQRKIEEFMEKIKNEKTNGGYKTV